MRKNLFHFKKWLTVHDAARHLTIMFGEEVREPAVLQLALDGHLALSVRFTKDVLVRGAEIVKYTEAQWEAARASGIMPGELQWKEIAEADLTKDHDPAHPPSVGDCILISPRLPDEQYLNVDDELAVIDGVWDLAPIGDGRRIIEAAYNRLIGGPAIRAFLDTGVFVMGKDSKLLQLLEFYEYNRWTLGSMANARALTRYMEEDGTPGDRKQALWNDFFAERERQKKVRNMRDATTLLDPVAELPEGASLVVTTENLKRFEHSLNDSPASQEKTLGQTERTSLLTIIAGLCNHVEINYRERGAARHISQLTEELGVPVSDDTVRRVLAKIPEALEARER